VVRGAVCHGLAKAAAHAPLRQDRDEIRLLTFSTDSASGIVTCATIIRQISKCEPITALSYPWGDSAQTEVVMLNGCRQRVTKNAVSLLRDLEYRRLRYVWINSPCIDQNNKEEKSHQVQLMARIYAKAEQVIAWVGTASNRGKTRNPTFTLMKYWACYHNYLADDSKIRDLNDDPRLW
jgi:hypothetical protein